MFLKPYKLTLQDDGNMSQLTFNLMPRRRILTVSELTALKFALRLNLLDAFTIGAESIAEQNDFLRRISAVF